MPVRPERLKGLAGDGRVQVTQITVIADTELRVDVLPPYPFVASVVTLGFVISGGQLLQSFGPFVVSFFVISHDDSFLNSRYMGFRPKSYGAGFSFFRPPGSLVRGRGVFAGAVAVSDPVRAGARAEGAEAGERDYASAPVRSRSMPTNT